MSSAVAKETEFWTWLVKQMKEQLFLKYFYKLGSKMITYFFKVVLVALFCKITQHFQ